jgi:hypothetical protein
MIVEVFSNGDVIFWILMIVANAFLFAAAASEETWGAGLTVLCLALLILLLFSSVGPAVAPYPGTVLLLAGAYLVVGFISTIPRWFVRLDELGLHYRWILAEFLAAHDVHGSTVPERLWSQWSQRIFQDRRLRAMRAEFDANTGLLEVPTARRNVDLLLVWWLLWPWSLIWGALGEQLKKIWRTIMRRLRAFYDFLSHWAFGE